MTNSSKMIILDKRCGSYFIEGTRSVPWTDFESLALINTWGEDQMQQELRGMHRNGHIFSIISNKMAAQGFSRTPEQCQTRLKRLKSNFRQCYQNMYAYSQQERVKGKVCDICWFTVYISALFLSLHVAWRDRSKSSASSTTNWDAY